MTYCEKQLAAMPIVIYRHIALTNALMKTIVLILGSTLLALLACTTTDPPPATPTPPTPTTPTPVITSLVPETGSWNEPIKIHGTGFNTTASLNTIFFGSVMAVVTSATATELTVNVPINVNVVSSVVSVHAFSKVATAPKPFVLAPPQLSGFSPAEGKRSATIQLTGLNFHPVPANNVVKIGTYTAQVTAATATLLTIKLPDFVGNFDSHVTISVEILGQQGIAAGLFKLLGPWKQIANVPGSPRKDAVSFSIGTVGYLGAGEEDPGSMSIPKPFWRYDPSTNTWESIADFFFTSIGTTTHYTNMVSLTANNQAFVGLGYGFGFHDRIQRYDPTTNIWSQSNGIGNGDPTQAVEGPVAFMINDKGYVVAGRSSSTVISSKVWSFNPVTEQWSSKLDFPGTPRWEAAGFAIGGKGHVVGGMPCSPCSGFELTDHWEYDAATDQWTQRANFPGQKRRRALAFSAGGYGFLMGGELANESVLKDFWMYDPSTLTWTQLPDFPGNAVGGATVFVIGQKAYLGTGRDSNGYRADMWEFDVSKF